MLYCKKLELNAKIPEVAHPGEDLGYDIFALEDAFLEKQAVTKVRTGIAARFIDDNATFSKLGGDGGIYSESQFGLLVKDRSSMASKGITVSAGVIDAGYSGEILVLLTNNYGATYFIKAGEKIAQLIPVKVNTLNGSLWVEELPKSNRKNKGFGSSGN